MKTEPATFILKEKKILAYFISVFKFVVNVLVNIGNPIKKTLYFVFWNLCKKQKIKCKNIDSQVYLLHKDIYRSIDIYL